MLSPPRHLSRLTPWWRGALGRGSPGRAQDWRSNKNEKIVSIASQSQAFAHCCSSAVMLISSSSLMGSLGRGSAGAGGAAAPSRLWRGPGPVSLAAAGALPIFGAPEAPVSSVKFRASRAVPASSGGTAAPVPEPGRVGWAGGDTALGMGCGQSPPGAGNGHSTARGRCWL